MGEPVKTSQSPYELEQRIRDALNAAKMALWELDLTDGAFQWTGRVTPHFFEFAQSIDGTMANYVSLIHEEDLHGVMDLLEQAAIGQSFFNQHRVKFPDQTYHWLEGIGTFIKGSGGLKLTGTVQDVTEKKRLEDEREDWKQKHELVATSAGLVIYDYNIETGKILWSGSTHELFGYSPQELGDISAWEKRIHKDDRREVVRELDIAMEKIGSFDVNYRFIRHDGSYSYVHDKGMFVGEDRAVKMLGMMEDVSESKKAESALKESESRFKSMILDMNMGVGLYDQTTKPILCNRKAYELLGMSEAQFMGKAALDESWKALNEQGETLLPDDFPIPLSIRTKKHIRDFIMAIYRPKSKDWIWLLVDVVPVYSKEDELIHVICTFSDITNLRMAQTSLTSKNKLLSNLSEELQARNDRLIEFAQIVSHNLRSPISSIVSLTKIVEDGTNQVVKDTALAHIATVSENALLTIDELTDVLKVQQENVRKQQLDIQNVFTRIQANHKGLISEAEAVFELDFQVQRLNYAKIYLESVFSNLLSNSLKYRSTIAECRISVRIRQDENNDIILEWKDNGIGIDLDKYEKDIFSLGKTFHRHADSRGVGLFLVKNQVETMGGEITVESSPGKGAKFIVNFTKNISANE